VSAQSTERYVRRDELAAIMGVSIATIDRLVLAGMPSVVWGARTRRFLPSEAIAWASSSRPGATVTSLAEHKRRV
jgi:phage terminase Nu1 subunit (DNA packaging protein)